MQAKSMCRTWIFTVAIFMFEAWSQDAVNRETAFNLGTNVKLRCANKMWADMLYTIWEINLKNRKCRISFINDGEGTDSCNDGKSLQKASTGQLYLHIPNISADDVGVYKCESVYYGGNENYNFKVAVTAPPSLYAWLEWRNNKMMALCRAERGTPAANLSWSYTGSSEPAVKTQLDTDGFVTVESHLELLEDINLEDLTCIIQHRYWDQEKILVPKPREANYSPLLWIRVALVIIFILSGFLVLKKCHPPLQNTSQPKIPANFKYLRFQPSTTPSALEDPFPTTVLSISTLQLRKGLRKIKIWD